MATAGTQKGRQADLDLRRTLLGKAPKAPRLWLGGRGAKSHRSARPGVNRLAHPAAAWIWRQLNDELDRCSSVSLEALQTKM